MYAPIRRFVKPGSRVAVLGQGGLGHLAIQFAASFGATVTSIDIDPTKAAEAKHLNASTFVPMSEYLTASGQLGKQYTGAFDVIINCVPSPLHTAALLASLASNGTLVQIGIPPAQETGLVVPLIPLVFGQKSIVGSIVGGA